MYWSDIREKLKSKDRYYRIYDNPESFWNTLDSRVVAWTYNIPIPVIGLILRIIYSIIPFPIIGMSNRYEPMPIGNRPHVNNLWKNKSPWKRYILWRIRNPWEDARKFYLGFATCNDVKKHQITDHFVIWAPKFKWLPFRLPTFPYYKRVIFGFQLMIGWKSRGIVSITFRRKS